MCQLATLKFQQFDGLNTVLPIGTRRINAFRTLTTESLAVFMPFKVQEVQDKGGIYFGENAISHNLIMCNKASLLNQSAFLLGVPGSGKSFSAKELIAFLILNTEDDVRICDPEKEFGALAAALGEETATVIHKSLRMDKQLKAQERELHKITNLCDILYIDWKSGDLTRDEYHRMKEKFEQQAKEIRESIAALQEEQTFISNGITWADTCLQTFLKYQNIDHLKRGIVVMLIKQINIYGGKRIEVEFNFADQHQRILDFIEANQARLNVAEHEAV